MTTPWPFAQWGLDIMGPFPIATRQLKFLVVGMECFTKWVEAEPLATTTEKNIWCFVWKNVVCWFGIPKVLVSDNSKQFDKEAFRDFCQQLGIKNHYSSLTHPQASGQIEVTNRSLLKIIKTWLEGAKGVWLDKLPSVFWAYRMTERTPTRETSFPLAFKSEVVILEKVGLTSFRLAHHDEWKNDEAIHLQLDLLDKLWTASRQQMAHYQHLMVKYYNTNIRHRHFKVEDLVLKKVTTATRDPTKGKLGLN